MPYFLLAQFLEELHQSGELARVDATVDPELEAAEITRRVARREGPALLFTSVRNQELPVLTNLLGTDERIRLALGVSNLEDLAVRMAELADPSEPERWFERLGAWPSRNAVGNLLPKSVKTGPSQQVIRIGSDVDLRELPVLRCQSAEAGPIMSAGLVVGADDESGGRVVERHELRVLAHDRLALCWSTHNELARLAAAYRQRDLPMPLAVVLGDDPAGLLAAMAPLPVQADACAVAGLLRGRPRELIRCRTIDLRVPADAEIIVEGELDPAEPPVDAGQVATWGDHNRPVLAAPVLRVTAITHRSNPIYQSIVPGGPPDEFCVIRRVLMRIFLPLVRTAIPDLVDCHFPMAGAARHLAFVSLRKSYAGQARRAAHAIWGWRPLMFAKLLVLVDEDVDVRRPDQVLAAVAAHADLGRDVLFCQGPPDPWDPAADHGGLGHRMAIDATVKLAPERRGRPSAAAPPESEIVRLVTERWPEYGLPAEDPLD
jgi:4-hydroxy-3-polyprenylbenzoate decarboxylase